MKKDRHPEVLLELFKETHPTGSLTSPDFVIDAGVVSFLIGGGCTKTGLYGERVELLVNNTVVRDYVTNSCAERMNRQTWKVSEFVNKKGSTEACGL